MVKTSLGGAARPSLVILIAYGPRPVTRAAVRNLNNLLPGVPVHQVSAFGGGATGKIEDILRVAGKKVVLFLHDDVTIQRRSVERLSTVALRSSSVVVPFSNDENCTNSLPGLLAGPNSKAMLTRIEDRAESKELAADSVRPSCMVARSDVLYRFLSHRLHDPLTSLRNAGSQVIAVSNAVALHDQSCTARLRSFKAPRDGTLLVASMIVKNEEAMLGDCLQSLEGVVDRVHICDTGSQDSTVAIAKASGAHLIEREWRDDFAWARNEVLAECRDAQWVLWIDADERLRVPDVDFFRSYLAAFGGEIEAFNIEIVNRSSSKSDKASSRFQTVRLFRADRSEFTGALHEQVRHGKEQRELKTENLSLLAIDHLGYAIEVVTERGKQERNVEISREAYEQEGDAKSAMDYARSLNLANEEPELVLQLLEESLAGMPESYPQARAYLLGFLARVLFLDHDQPLEAVERATEALSLVPTDDVSLGVLGQALVDTGQYLDLIEFHEGHSFAPLPRAATVVEAARSRYLRSLALAYLQNGDIESAWTHLGEMASLDVDLDRDDLTVVIEVARRRGLERSLVSITEPLVAPEWIDEMVDLVASSSPPKVTAEVCIALLEAGIESSGTVATGILAAVLCDEIAIAKGIAKYAALLDQQVAEKLSLRLEQRGHLDLAKGLQLTQLSV